MAMPWRRRLLLATPLPAAWMSSVVIHNVYVKFYTDVVGLDPKYIGWVYLIFNIWNVLNDPVFGVLLDKMRYRPDKGKFLLVMRVTVPFILIGLALMAWTPSSWPQAAIFTVFLLELFLFDVAATLYLISATSYLYLATPPGRTGSTWRWRARGSATPSRQWRPWWPPSCWWVMP